MRSETKQRIASVLKFAWYLCASVLILSLPTFSYLLPRQTASGSPATVSRPLADRSAAQGGEKAGGAFSNFVRGALASLTGGAADKPAGARPRAGEDSRDSSGNELATVASTPRWLPPERFEQRRSRLGPPLVDGGDESEPASLEPGLTDLEQGYEQAFNSLFPEVFFGVPVIGNPFERALGGDSGASGGTGDPNAGGAGGGTSPPGDGASNPPPGNSGNPPPGGEGSPPGGSGSDVVEPPGAKEPGFNFLIVGDFPGVSGSQLSRARLQIDGQFVLENSFSFGFFPGILHSLLTFQESEKVIIDDLDADGSLDFVVATEVPAVGTAIESYVQLFPGQFQLSASAFLYLREIRSLALFDFDRDGVDELALVLAGHPNLVIYQRVGAEWLYLRELSLPFRPALVMSAPVAVGVRARSLYVLDENLEFTLSSTDRQPETFRPGASLPLNHLRRVQINLSGRSDDPGEVAVFSLPGRLILCDGRGASLRSFASFRMSNGAPLMIIGDYTRTATRQMLWVP